VNGNADRHLRVSINNLETENPTIPILINLQPTPQYLILNLLIYLLTYELTY